MRRKFFVTGFEGRIFVEFFFFSVFLYMYKESFKMCLYVLCLVGYVIYFIGKEVFFFMISVGFLWGCFSRELVRGFFRA